MRPIPQAVGCSIVLTGLLLVGCGVQLHPLANPSLLPSEHSAVDPVSPDWDQIAEPTKATVPVLGEPLQPAQIDSSEHSLEPSVQVIWETRPWQANPTPPQVHTAGSLLPTSVRPAMRSKSAEEIPLISADTPSTPVAKLPSPTMPELLAQLLQQLRCRDDAPLVKALNAAALSVVDSERGLDPDFLEPLSSRQRAHVDRYYQMLTMLKSQLATDPDDRGLGHLVEQVNGLFPDPPVAPDPPVKLSSVQLCSRVSGYGVYELIKPERFLAGREHQMIVYTELDHFDTVSTNSGEHEVKLNQELELYDHDGLMVWRHEPVQIVDRSRNKRHDFFTVQLISLPARLTVGQFYLKVRIRDEHGQSRAEHTVDLEIVAGETLAAN